MGQCFGKYGSGINCNSCKVKNSCQRKSKTLVRSHSSTTLANKVLNILKRTLKPMSTYRLRIELWNNYHYPISDYTLKEYMLALRKQRIINLKRTKKGRFWSLSL